MGRRFALAVVAAFAGAVPAAAQRGIVDIAPLARYTTFDESLFLENGLGIGGRFTLFFADKWTAEVTATRTETEDDLTGTANVIYVPLHIRVNFVEPISTRARMVVGAGYVHNQYLGDADGQDDGATGMFGFEVDLNQMFRARLDFAVDYMTGNPAGGNADNWNNGFQLSLSYRLVKGGQ